MTTNDRIKARRAGHAHSHSGSTDYNVIHHKPSISKRCHNLLEFFSSNGDPNWWKYKFGFYLHRTWKTCPAPRIFQTWESKLFYGITNLSIKNKILVNVNQKPKFKFHPRPFPHSQSTLFHFLSVLHEILHLYNLVVKRF